MKYQGIFIADLHIGATARPQLESEIEEILYSYIREHDLDFVIFCGDYFDRKFYLNDENAVFATEVINTIDRLLKPEAKIRMVYGTKSHEEDQYESFKVLQDHRDFNIIYNVSEEELFPDMHVLYLPEELLVDSDSYYEEFFEEEDKYDLIVGHGIIKEAMQKSAHDVEEKKNVQRKVPVFRTGELLKACRGMTIFGHYHVSTYIPDENHQVCYVGSFSRWKFGEEEEKGFLSGTFDSKKSKWNTEFIPNVKAEVYKTLGLGYQNQAFESIDDLKKKMDQYEKLTNSGVFDHLKIDFNIPETCDNAEYYIDFIKERFKNQPEVKVDITNGYIEKKRKDSKKELQEDYEKYARIFDPNAKLEEQVSYFIEIQYNRSFSPELASLYLYNSLADVLKVDPDDILYSCKPNIDHDEGGS